MREVKFRAWDKESKEMFRVVMIGFGWPRGEKDIISGRGGSIDNAILMQFTGIKDRYGKEIYEGDIIRTTGPSGSKTTPNRVVKWQSKVNMIGFNLGDAKATKKEVIGNIYETPELIP